MKNKLVAALVGLMTLVGLNSCLVMESTVTLNKDGSGTVTEAVYFGEQMQQMMAMGGQAENPIEDMLDVAKASERAKGMGEGVTFLKAEAAEKDGMKGAIAVYTFTDINKLRYDGPNAMEGLAEQMAPGAPEEEKEQSFFYEDGVLTIKNDAEDMGLGDMADMEDMDPAQLEMMKGMFKGMRMTMSIEIVDGIAETNASFVEGNKIIAADVQMDKMIQNGEALKALSKAKNSEEAAEILNGIDGVKVESKEEVRIKLK